MSLLPPDIQDKIYRPNAEEAMKIVTVHRTEDGLEPPEPDFELATDESE